LEQRVLISKVFIGGVEWREIQLVFSCGPKCS
jgi:hypothetical protein